MGKKKSPMQSTVELTNYIVSAKRGFLTAECLQCPNISFGCESWFFHHMRRMHRSVVDPSSFDGNTPWLTSHPTQRHSGATDREEEVVDRTGRQRESKAAQWERLRGTIPARWRACKTRKEIREKVCREEIVGTLTPSTHTTKAPLLIRLLKRFILKKWANLTELKKFKKLEEVISDVETNYQMQDWCRLAKTLALKQPADLKASQIAEDMALLALIFPRKGVDEKSLSEYGFVQCRHRVIAVALAILNAKRVEEVKKGKGSLRDLGKAVQEYQKWKTMSKSTSVQRTSDNLWLQLLADGSSKKDAYAKGLFDDPLIDTSDDDDYVADPKTWGLARKHLQIGEADDKTVTSPETSKKKPETAGDDHVAVENHLEDGDGNAGDGKVDASPSTPHNTIDVDVGETACGGKPDLAVSIEDNVKVDDDGEHCVESDLAHDHIGSRTRSKLTKKKMTAKVIFSKAYGSKMRSILNEEKSGGPESPVSIDADDHDPNNHHVKRTKRLLRLSDKPADTNLVVNNDIVAFEESNAIQVPDAIPPASQGGTGTVESAGVLKDESAGVLKVQLEYASDGCGEGFTGAGVLNDELEYGENESGEGFRVRSLGGLPPRIETVAGDPPSSAKVGVQTQSSEIFPRPMFSLNRPTNRAHGLPGQLGEPPVPGTETHISPWALGSMLPSTPRHTPFFYPGMAPYYVVGPTAPASFSRGYPQRPLPPNEFQEYMLMHGNPWGGPAQTNTWSQLLHGLPPNAPTQPGSINDTAPPTSM